MMAVPRRVRLLPLVIATMTLLIGCKVWTVAHNREAWGGSVLASAGRAVLPAAQAAAEQKPAPPAIPAKAPVAAAPAAPPLPAEPVVSDAERSLLQDLRARRTSLDARDAELKEREGVLAAAEKRLAARVDELQALQARLETMDQARRERDDANWRSLVKTYEVMRPRDAAAIFNELDQPVLIQVLDRMKEAKAAPVLAAMQPERARTATTDLARWRSRTTGEAVP